MHAIALDNTEGTAPRDRGPQGVQFGCGLRLVDERPPGARAGTGQLRSGGDSSAAAAA